MGVEFDMNIAHYTPPTHINSRAVNKNKTLNNSKTTIPTTTTNTNNRKKN